MVLPAALRRLFAAPATGRLALVDAARGAALLAMALYHTTWDLGFLRLTPENYALTPPGRAAAHGIAGSFLVLVGISLVLAQGKVFRPRPYLARVARIGLAAGAITLATLVVFPDSWIFFGVLHCIALGSLIALPALRAPLLPVLAAAALVLAAPHLLALADAPPAFLDAPPLLFLGLGRIVPSTNDYVPLFPWFGCILAGIFLGRLGLPRLARSRLGTWRPTPFAGRLLVGAGRHSLAIYLVHQPLLFGLLSGVAAVTGPHPHAGEASFLRDYRETCAQAGGSEARCRVGSRCLLERLRAEGLWEAAGRGGLTPEQRTRAVEMSQACFAQAPAP